ncbi:MAG TPA: aminoacyl-histidine dipeptidase [Clostridiales bacterium]|nr:aminoacyl-histidine dipeptidase [Clostridiales bacterium]
MNNILTERDYKDVFKYFSEISKIPRASGNEKMISDFIVSFAKERELEYVQDEAGNVIIIKNPTRGYENEEAIILQAHMDMVCEKKTDSIHDFDKDEIRLLVNGDFIHADGTTLGADDGIGLAYILAILADDGLHHPRLEAIITTDEEVGMHGAKALDLTNLKAKYMINLDSEEEGHMLTSCAGGLTGTATIPVVRISDYGKKVRIRIKGLKGGHSGSEIHKNRSNATKLLARLLFELRAFYSFSLIDMFGGFKDNVIPREAEAEIFIPVSSIKEPIDVNLLDQFKGIKDKINELINILQKELSNSEPYLDYEIQDLEDGEYMPIDSRSFEKVLFHLINIPYGVQVMSQSMEGLVESSLNLGMFKLNDDSAEFCSSIRSSVESYKNFMSNKLEYATNFIGGDYKVRNEYPAWEFKAESKLREHLKRIYLKEYNKDIKVEAIHAGLECGLISKKMPELDIVSIGPDMYDVHTIDERVSITSTINVYKYLEKVIEEKIL